MKHLSRILDLRASIRSNEIEISDITPAALNEALEAISNQTNQTAIRNDKGRIVVYFRKRYPSLKESKNLERYDALISDAKLILADAKREQIEAINQQIEEHKEAIKLLEEEKEKLTTNNRIITLKAKYLATQEEESWLEPSLSVYLK